MENIKEYIRGEVAVCTRALFDIREMRNRANLVCTDAAFQARAAFAKTKNLLDIIDSNPEIASSLGFDKVQSLRKDYSYYLRNYNEDPVERFLNWSRTGDDSSFVLSDALFEFLGKEDYRTFKALLREVIEKVDPVKAKDF